MVGNSKTKKGHKLQQRKVGSDDKKKADSSLDNNTKLEQVDYLIRHVNFGSDDGTPSSKFEIDFSCRDYTQARAIFNLVVNRTKYKSSKLVLSYQHPLHLSSITALPYEDTPPIYSPPKLDGVQYPISADRVRGVAIDGLKDQSVTVHRGKTGGHKGISTGRGYLAAIPASAKRAFLFHKDESPIGPTTAIKLELVLEVCVGPDNRWYSSKYVEILNDSQSSNESNESIATAVFLESLIKELNKYVVDCPHCAHAGMSRSEKCFVEKLVRYMGVESKCIRCHRSFFITLSS